MWGVRRRIGAYTMTRSYTGCRLSRVDIQYIWLQVQARYMYVYRCVARFTVTWLSRLLADHPQLVWSAGGRHHPYHGKQGTPTVEQ